jgi:protein phosphatase
MLGDTSTASGLHNRQEDNSIPAAVTDIGCERDINEDRYAVIDSPVGRAWVVCDGMGGALGGELAAQLAIDAIRRKLEAANSSNIAELLSVSIEEANRVIVLRRQNPAFSAMGTTVVAALIQGDQISLTHAGDSRAYLVRGPQIQQLTVDHTYVQELVERGAIGADEALSHPQAHVLTKCLGAEPRLDLQTQQYWIWDTPPGEEEDKLVLCSDGLYSLVPDQEIAQMVTRNAPQESCMQLVDLAKKRGGFDNITVTILPLGGQLREESPPPKVTARVKPTASSASLKQPKPRKKMSIGKRLSLMLALFILGGVLSLIVLLAKLMG